MIDTIIKWFNQWLLPLIKQHVFIFYWLACISGVLFIASVIAVPLVIINLPEDFLVRHKRKQKIEKIGFVFQVLVIIPKNIIGVILIIAGILMLVLPGQGILTIMIGLTITDFPGKHNLLFWIAGNPLVLKGINWIREKNNRKKLVMHGEGEEKKV